MERDHSKRRSTGPGARDQDPLLDFSLGREEKAAAERPPSAVRRPEPAQRRPLPPSRRGRALPWLLLVAVLAAVALAAGWLLRPEPPLLRASAPLLDFGARRLGGDAGVLELRLANAGGRGLAVGAIAVAGDGAVDFAVVEDRCTGVRLGAGEECALAIGFEPGAEGPRRAVLEIDARAANAPLAVPLLGAGAAARLAVGRGELSFSPREVGSAGAPAAVTIENRGGVPLRIEQVRLEGAAAGDFRAGGRCAGRSLGPDESCAVTFVFTPRAAGERRASALVVSDAPGRPPVIALHGTGTERAAKLVFAPDEVDFGAVAVGAEPAARRLTVTNRGDAEARVAAVRPAERESGFRVREDACSGAVLVPGGACAVSVAFAPAAAGAAETPLRVELEGGEPGPWVRLAGVGEGVRMTAAPARLDFGAVRTGQSAERGVTVANPSRVAITLRRVAVEGADAADFRLAGGCAEGARLAPGGSCTLSVRFAPAETGERVARLVVEPAAAGRLEVPLAGAAAAPPVARARIAPAAIEFGEQPVGGRSGIRDVTLSNAGDARLTLAGVVVEGEHAGDFRLVPGSCAGAGFVAPGGDCSVGVRFTPTAAGPRRAEVVVRHGAAGGRSAVRLSGTGGAP